LADSIINKDSASYIAGFNAGNKSLIKVNLPYTATEDTLGVGIVCAAWRSNAPSSEYLYCYLQKNGSTILTASSATSGNLTASVGVNSGIFTINKGDVFSLTTTKTSTVGSPVITNANAYLYILQ